MQKELVTIEAMKKGLIKERIYAFKELIVIFLFLLLLTAIFCINILSWRINFITVLFSAFMVFMVFVMVFCLYDTFAEVFIIKTNRFTVLKDRLYNKEIKEEFLAKSHKEHFKHILNFSKSGEYYLYQDEYYTYLDSRMNYKSVYKTAVDGDEFYVVITNKKKILTVFNCKLFELSEK